MASTSPTAMLASAGVKSNIEARNVRSTTGADVPGTIVSNARELAPKALIEAAG
ncbi:MAG: hypothetical protein NVS3B5_21170 [Sphingomicrobium sp.]